MLNNRVPHGASGLLRRVITPVMVSGQLQLLRSSETTATVRSKSSRTNFGQHVEVYCVSYQPKASQTYVPTQHRNNPRSWINMQALQAHTQSPWNSPRTPRQYHLASSQQWHRSLPSCRCRSSTAAGSGAQQAQLLQGGAFGTLPQMCKAPEALSVYQVPVFTLATAVYWFEMLQ